jgi:hypothetical protein
MSKSASPYLEEAKAMIQERNSTGLNVVDMAHAYAPLPPVPYVRVS